MDQGCVCVCVCTRVCVRARVRVHARAHSPGDLYPYPNSYLCASLRLRHVHPFRESCIPRLLQEDGQGEPRGAVRCGSDGADCIDGIDGKWVNATASSRQRYARIAHSLFPIANCPCPLPMPISYWPTCPWCRSGTMTHRRSIWYEKVAMVAVGGGGSSRWRW